MQLLRLAWAVAGAALGCFLIFLLHTHFVKEGQLAAGTCEIVTLDRDSSQPRRTVARQTARCACRKGQIAGTTRARPACVDARIVRTKQWCEMMPCLDNEGCNLLVNKSGWTCTQPGGRVKTTTVCRTQLGRGDSIACHTLTECLSEMRCPRAIPGPSCTNCGVKQEKLSLARLTTGSLCVLRESVYPVGVYQTVAAASDTGLFSQRLSSPAARSPDGGTSTRFSAGDARHVPLLPAARLLPSSVIGSTCPSVRPSGYTATRTAASPCATAIAQLGQTLRKSATCGVCGQSGLGCDVTVCEDGKLCLSHGQRNTAWDATPAFGRPLRNCAMC
ncbi:protein FAM19A5-like [Arapaima gigas]